MKKTVNYKQNYIARHTDELNLSRSSFLINEKEKRGSVTACKWKLINE